MFAGLKAFTHGFRVMAALIGYLGNVHGDTSLDDSPAHRYVHGQIYYCNHYSLPYLNYVFMTFLSLNCNNYIHFINYLEYISVIVGMNLKIGIPDIDTSCESKYPHRPIAIYIFVIIIFM